MQQTKLDRHLRQKYSFVTHVFSNTKPKEIPRGIRCEELDRQKGAPYRFRFSSRKYELIARLALSLESENITYTSRVVDRKVWYGKWINNPRNSFTYRMVWIGLFVVIVAVALSPLPGMLMAYIEAEEKPDDPKVPKETIFAKVKKTGEKLDSYAGFSEKWNEFFGDGEVRSPIRKEDK